MFCGLLAYLSITEYKPAPKEDAEVISLGDALPSAKAGQTLSLLSWNIGYGALGDNADFFMDGGSSVMSADEARVRENLTAIGEHLLQTDTDLILLQEVDQKSRRSFDIDEAADLRSLFGTDMCSTFANNYKALVPYPVPPIGRVDSGVLTLSKFQISEASRIWASSTRIITRYS